MISKLESYLNSKPLYFDKIDFNIVKEAWEIISKEITLPYVIHIIGTNGKGSTGRFLASFLTQLNKKTLHYSSPHILEFNERIWINNQNSTDEDLDKGHEKLQKHLPLYLLERLTYFEYTTLVALVLSDKLDYLVLEAGLGGEFDATNVVKNDLTLLTTIGLDHQNFLGNTIKEITLTKVKSCDNRIIVGYQQDSDVYNYIRELFENNREIIFLKSKNIDSSNYNNNMPAYLENNLKHTLFTLKYLNLPIKDFNLPTLFGRYQNITNNITIDVGHNPLAAKVISKELENSSKKIDLIYNSYEDKDYKNVLKILKNHINKIYIIPCDDKRVVDIDILKITIEKLDIPYDDFSIDKINSDDNYLVFGSFLVVEEFLKQFNYDK
ncbi:MAG: bifunctional folylpolyglutamate synthase/dihydrofolate synthase [Campylobacterota bacterium]|nr:bifunctional folylpolyglutamate synthase/dihydrofolate synthase [Campylobacterota bacterium]